MRRMYSKAQLDKIVEEHIGEVTAPVTSVNTKIGDVVLNATDIKLTTNQQTVQNNFIRVDDELARIEAEIPEVSVSATGTSTNTVNYITIDDTEYKLPSGGSGSIDADDLIALLEDGSYIESELNDDGDKVVIDIKPSEITDTPTYQSTDLMTSGGVYNTIQTLATKTELNAKQDTITTSTTITPNNVHAVGTLRAQYIESNDTETANTLEIKDLASKTEVAGKLDANKNAIARTGGLVVPSVAPASTILVGIDTDRDQENITIGSGLTLTNNVLSAGTSHSYCSTYNVNAGGYVDGDLVGTVTMITIIQPDDTHLTSTQVKTALKRGCPCRILFEEDGGGVKHAF